VALSPSPLRIIADVHERPSGLAERLAGLGIDVETRYLTVGDYVVGPATVVERKTVRGVHAAILEGSLWPQLGKLRRAVRSPWLLIEGAALDDGPLSPPSIRGLCLAVADLGIHIIRADGKDDSAQWLHRLAARRQRDRLLGRRPPYAQRPTPKTPKETAEGVLAAVPGISTVSARALLARFGSVSGVLAATREEWEDVAGIGPVRAQSLQEALVSQRRHH
jgi:ERCC4-type nuclease